MAGEDTRWGSNRTRQMVLTIILAGVLFIAMALAAALVRVRTQASSSKWGRMTAPASTAGPARKPNLPQTDS